MIETAIIGAGLCGLAIARGLQRQGASYAVYEARWRLGGRVQTALNATTGMAVDLGPTWYWPETQPRMARLVDELGLESFPQHDTGELLDLADHDKAPVLVQRTNLHEGARRLEGGMGSLIRMLAADLPETALQLRHELVRVVDRGDHVLLQFRRGEDFIEVPARRVVLALPPRLLEQRLDFQPPLDDALRQTLRATATWMAAQAKALVVYRKPFWRQQGHSGNAFVHHGHAVLGEIFDACDAEGERAALGGFFSLPAELRQALKAGMAMLVSSQMVQLFGQEAENGRQYLQDWATEAYTCADLDLTEPARQLENGHPELRREHWGGRLQFAGSETAAYGGGHLEGALDTAARVLRALQPAQQAPAAADHNAASLGQFGEWVGTQQPAAFERYRRLFQQDLALQRHQQLTQRSVLTAMEQTYGEALAQLEQLPLTDATPAQQGRSSLTPLVLAPFSGFNKSLLEQVVAYNRSSCAISNFPDEHQVPPDYLETIARDLAAAWREFALAANQLLLAKTGVAEAA